MSMKSGRANSLGQDFVEVKNTVEQEIEKGKSFGETSLLFPTDLNHIHFFPEQMKFSIYERTGVSLDKITKTVKNDFTKFVKGGDDEPTNKTNDKNSAKDADVNAGKRTIGKQFVETGTKVLDEISEGVKERNNLTTKDKLKHTIFLPMAKEITNTDSVSWSASDLGSMGAILKGDLTGGAAATALSMSAMGMGGVGGGILGKLLGSGIGGAVAGTLASEGLQKGIEAAAGIKANPYKEQTFEGIEFRKFSFSYLFNPKNQTEVIILDKIIRAFRAYSKPSFSKTSNGIFKYPHEFQIEFLTHDKQEDELVTNVHLPQLKYCVCTSVNTNFATREWRSFEGGAPVEVSLQLDFEETELITQEDVMGATPVGRFRKTGRTF